MLQKILILSLFLLAACQNDPTPISTALPPRTVLLPTTPTLAATPTQSLIMYDDTGPHFLLSIMGDVTLMRDGWNNYYPATFGVALASADLLKVDGEARVLCVGDQLTIETVSSGQNRVPCPFETGLLTHRVAVFSTQRMGSVAMNNTPFILYPRSTLVLTDRPTLYWNDTGAGSYSVMLTEGGQNVWSGLKTATGNILPYPTDEPPLEVGKNYHLVVVDDDSQISSRQNEPPGTGFALASGDTKTAIEAGVAEISTLTDLTNSEQAFVLGIYYAGIPVSTSIGFAPLGEAWLVVNQLQTTNPTPAISLLYGDILERLSLPDLADVAYLTAMDNAIALGDLENQAAANARLWCSTADEKYHDEADRLFKKIGDQHQLEVLLEDPTEC